MDETDERKRSACAPRQHRASTNTIPQVLAIQEQLEAHPWDVLAWDDLVLEFQARPTAENIAEKRAVYEQVLARFPTAVRTTATSTRLHRTPRPTTGGSMPKLRFSSATMTTCAPFSAAACSLAWTSTCGLPMSALSARYTAS